MLNTTLDYDIPQAKKLIRGEYPYLHDDDTCIWYGECGDSNITGKTVNCLYNNRSLPLTDTLGIGMLEEVCPNLAFKDETTGEYMTCCDTEQLGTLQRQTAFTQSAFARCPACLANFMNLYCQSTCSRHNSRFVNATVILEREEHNETQIYEVDYYLTQRYADGLFYSCNEVIFPSTNSPVIGLMCGSYSAEDCTAQRWLDYMGNIDNGVTPFQMNFIITPNGTDIGFGIEPMNTRFVPCNEAPTNDTYSCSCQDCSLSCGDALERPPEEEPWLIAGIDAILFIMIMVFCLFVVVYLGLLAFYYIKVKESNVDYDLDDKELYVDPDEISCFDKSAYNLDKYMTIGFTRWGILVTSHPIKVIVIALILVTICGLGNMFIVITVDPIDLWVSEDSQCLKEKEYFDTHFQPFWRIAQVIITATEHNSSIYESWPNGVPENFGPVLQRDFLHQVLIMQDYLNYMEVYYEPDDEYITSADICYKPLEPDNMHCAIQSVLQYYQNDHELLNKVVHEEGDEYSADYRDHFLYCVNSPTSVQDTTPYAEPCLAEYGGPTYPYTCMGGYDDDNYNNATALLITFLNDNYIDNDKAVDKVDTWEGAFLEVVSHWNNSNFSLSYFAERSIEDELIRASKADISTIVISYIFIFCYITLALGEIYHCDRLLIDSKVTLGLGGILLILCSVFAAMGVYGYIGVESTLIIIAVVPFLLLAVGADMMFIFVLDYQRTELLPEETRDQKISRVLGCAAPSMVLCSLTESITFFLGALTTMPAVRTFALYAGLAVLFNFLLLISAFTALLALDLRRQDDNRFDVCCCIPPRKKSTKPKHREVLHSFMKKYYAPFIVNKWVRPVIIITFVGFMCCCVVWMPQVTIGLDASLAMPSDSYILDFYADLSEYLMVGAPVYFVVVGGYNYSTIEGQNRICGGAGCNADSLTQQIYYASQDPEYTSIALPAMSWIDDHLDWVQPTLTVFRPCCRTYRFDEDKFCRSDEHSDALKTLNCKPCLDLEQSGERPTVQQFNKYLPWFLDDLPTKTCQKGGKAAYSASVEMLFNNTVYWATNFMTFHTVMITSQEFTMGLAKARNISDNITLSLNADGGDHYVFPYSLSYIYYEQYLTMVEDSLFQLTIALIAVFCISFLLLGFDILSTVCIVLTITMILIDMVGCMYLWDIDLNAISLVNLVLAVGMSIEFISHITRYFAFCTEKTRVKRAEKALAHMGSSILSGVALTNLVGTIPLAFANSQLFVVFYFRMFLLITILGCAHGIIFQPVLLIYLVITWGDAVTKT
ncbi:NPC intracellular cholesterol transporter 1-like [Saccoglossus kowalevskii]